MWISGSNGGGRNRHERNASDKSEALALIHDLNVIKRQHDADHLKQKFEEFVGVVVRMFFRNPAWLLARLDYVRKRREDMRDVSGANALFGQADRARANNDVAGLQTALRQLGQLLPPMGRRG